MKRLEVTRCCGRGGQEVVLFGSSGLDNSSWEHLAPKPLLSDDNLGGS